MTHTPVNPAPQPSSKPDPTPGSPAELAIPRLLDEYGPRLYSLALRLCGNAADAQDMVQEVFLQAHRKWSLFRGEASPSTWLYAIAARSCKDRIRRKGGADRRMPAISQLMPFRDGQSVDLPAIERSGGPVATLIDREAAEAVRTAILALPEHFRVPLVLKEMLELPIEEVAEALGLKPATVKTRVHRARLLLRKFMLDSESLPKRDAPAPSYDRRVCLDLLKAKLEAMDQGRRFPVGQEVVCERCRAVFAELDLAQSTCAHLADGDMPDDVRAKILGAIRAAA